MSDRAQARAALLERDGSLTPGQAARRFQGVREARVEELLDTMVEMGQARVVPGAGAMQGATRPEGVGLNGGDLGGQDGASILRGEPGGPLGGG